MRRVYRGGVSSTIKKSLCHEPVTQVASRLRRNCACARRRRREIAVCGAISAHAQPCVPWEDFAATILHTTLVLRRYPPDFSTEAINSALILPTTSPRARTQRMFGVPARAEAEAKK